MDGLLHPRREQSERPPTARPGRSTFADGVRPVTPYLGRALVTPSAAQRIHRQASLLPPVHRGGFECRLDASDGRVDLHQIIYPVPSERVALREHLRDAQTDWPTAARLARRWDDPYDLLHRDVGAFFLECDLVPRQRADGMPSVFLGARGDTGPDVVHEAQQALVDAPSPRQMRSVDRCLTNLPEGARISHVGFLMRRRGVEVRLNVANLRVPDMLDYLDRIEWPGDRAALRSTVPLLDGEARLRLALGIREGITARLGFEYPDAPRYEPPASWSPRLDRLVEWRLCDDARRAGILAWAGRADPSTAPHAWPVEYAFVGMLLKGQARSVMRREISHIKVTLEPGTGLRAKAYLFFTYEWLREWKRGASAEREVDDVEATGQGVLRGRPDRPRPVKGVEGRDW